MVFIIALCLVVEKAKVEKRILRRKIPENNNYQFLLQKLHLFLWILLSFWVFQTLNIFPWTLIFV
jgi:hypothetical protein